ncbi:prolyl aminopeptidase [Rheinheimera sp.]|jgi:proline iminopeptidase|uniref:prolyl aminopeptidase n=1 Tax=Rheinheimera TaxID=67575 RepID=UPI002354110F|nr:prolyl aminopeptidase [Rheinheimera sp.]
MPYLDVGYGHQLHYEIAGDITTEVPLLFVHGGPGAGVSDTDKALFAGLQRPVVYFDQRGCGQSRFEQRLNGNTTEQLIDDIEKLRKALSLPKLILVGGSWGSTLSLLYALRHPQYVESMLLWGVFLCRQQELDWFYLNGASQLYPEEYQKFMHQVGDAADPVAAYFDVLSTGSEELQQAAATSWARWEAVNSFFDTNEATLQRFTQADSKVPMALLESYYFKHQGFLPPDYILRHCELLHQIPVDIVQGRLDTICPCGTAWQLAKQLPLCRLYISPRASHAASEPENFSALRTLLHKLEPAA